MKSIIIQLARERQREAELFVKDLFRLRAGGKRVLFAVLASGAMFAVSLANAVKNGFLLIDPLIGARAVRAMTSEVESLLLWQLVLALVVTVLYVFVARLTGLARRVTLAIFWGTLTALSALFVLPLAPTVTMMLVVLFIFAGFVRSATVTVAVGAIATSIVLLTQLSFVDAMIFNRMSLSEGFIAMTFSLVFIASAFRLVWGSVAEPTR